MDSATAKQPLSKNGNRTLHKKLELSKKDLELIKKLRRDGVLQDVASHLVDEREGVIMVTCADGDQMADVLKHHETIALCHREDFRVHLLSLNGGAKLIPLESPLSEFSEGTLLVNQIKAARAMKNINTVVLYVHAPCGAAYAKGISFEKVLELLFAGKERVKNEIHKIKVACFCHIDYGKKKKKKKTYFISRDCWLAWKTEQKDT